jgi:osmotically inducible lipoprotein OsmB
VAHPLLGQAPVGERISSSSFRGEAEMTSSIRTVSVSALVLALATGLGACSNMSRQDKATAIGAGLGAVGGSVLTNGSAAGTVGGAVVGGVIGHETEKKK